MNLLLRGILGKAWAIDQRFVQAHLPYIVSLVNGGVAMEMPSDILASKISILDSNAQAVSQGTVSNAPKGSVAVISLSGPIMKNDQACGPVGTATIAEWIKAADTNPNITGIVLQLDTPGGTVDGTEELARVIASVKKPIVGYVDGLCASAGYWAASQCDEIMASGKTSEIGSIGVMSSWADMQPMLEAEGVVFHDVYATESTNKNKAYKQAKAGNYDPLISELDTLNNIFASTVKKGRKAAGINDAVFSGDMYFATEAKKMGLIDSIGTLQDAIKAVQKKSQSQTMSKTNNAATFPLICATLGWAQGFEATEEGVHMSMDSLAAIEAALVVAAVPAAVVEPIVDTAEVDRLTNALNELQTKYDALSQAPVHSGTQTAVEAEAEATMNT